MKLQCLSYEIRLYSRAVCSRVLYSSITINGVKMPNQCIRLAGLIKSHFKSKFRMFPSSPANLSPNSRQKGTLFPNRSLLLNIGLLRRLKLKFQSCYRIITPLVFPLYMGAIMLNMHRRESKWPNQ
jgi:hypothetical protein